ncbi:CinA family protein [Allobaculum stercoricanis]|uniref:CinA family protein n=1 Tax=Allobaculum stercoricanis TaxID=174709 RepID=UPI00037DA4F8|nr:CinA family protein [Allobaculum stercoricanis]
MMNKEVEYNIDFDQAQNLIELAKKKQVTISSCESFTAGLFSATLASIPGASWVLKGGFVTYFTEMKTILAHVDLDLIQQKGVVSKECAMAMASQTRKLTNSDYSVSFTGNAGPSSMEGKPAGLFYCAIATKEQTKFFEYQVDLERNHLRGYAVNQMIQELIHDLEHAK